MLTCFQPNPPNEQFPSFDGIISCDDLELYKIWDNTLAVSSISNEKTPTWSAYNCLVTNALSTRVCQSMPLYPGSPSDWSNLYTALKMVQGINVSTIENHKTIVTLDLQLYNKCMQLREKEEISQNFIFRLGELHTVFAALKVLGKYLKGSGLDQIITEAGIYDQTTLGQIMEGKHMKRGVECHLTLYLALYTLYFKEALEGSDVDDSEVKGSVKTTISSFLDVDKGDQQLHWFHRNQIMAFLETSGATKLLSDFHKTFKNQPLFLHNYMKMFEVLLLFIRANRQGLWKLHLSSLNIFVSYFFAHDQINYARLSPFYLATMVELELKDEVSWNYLKEHYSIFKSPIPFVGIGSDHAMEQENKTMKMSGGVVGLTQQPEALNRFCLAAPILANLAENFNRNMG